MWWLLRRLAGEWEAEFETGAIAEWRRPVEAAWAADVAVGAGRSPRSSAVIKDEPAAEAAADDELDSGSERCADKESDSGERSDT